MDHDDLLSTADSISQMVQPEHAGNRNVVAENLLSTINTKSQILQPEQAGTGNVDHDDL